MQLLIELAQSVGQCKAAAMLPPSVGKVRELAVRKKHLEAMCRG